MKQKLSVTIDKELLSKLDGKLQNKILRNRSHLVEIALIKYLEEECKE
ncbi:MAG: hypothetical protein ABIJ18_01080 [archaeon]